MSIDSALVLTEDEWAALSHICNHFLMATRWADMPRDKQAPTKALLDQRDLALRVQKATT